MIFLQLIGIIGAFIIFVLVSWWCINHDCGNYTQWKKAMEEIMEQSKKTTMYYEQKYKEAFDLIRTYHDWYIIQGNNGGTEILKDIFSEFKKNKDKRMRKAIIRILKGEMGYISKEDADKYIDWLENQGKSVLEMWKDMRLEVYQQASGNRHEPNYSDDSTKMFSLNDIDEIIEKINDGNN